MITIKCPICKALLKTDEKGMYYCGKCPYKETHKSDKHRIFGRLNSQFDDDQEVALPKSPYNKDN